LGIVKALSSVYGFDKEHLYRFSNLLARLIA